ncbi:hypothetical protein [Bradyrhizobium sp. BWC-3-1]|uniref:hypothetical protein n=1 Tax=Bradyrhizobium sp. BWC-3-1 TaxID=3080012 RepID=UPI00293EF8FF|nr:hypothetical protein [Bradyrhizobium sp. BWC-3-1]WOH60231.1 hypothetical protein RX329_09015 [Bradyrhizobium sp. BWC-3-1]
MLDWRESGVQMPDGSGRPARKGYGSELIEGALPYQLNAKTCLEFGPDGVRCRIATEIESHGLWMADAARSVLQGRHVLVVEDEYMIAVDLARALEDLGATVIGPAASLADALALVAGESALDFAILAVNLGVEKVFQVADDLRARGVPFIFATGYDQWLIPSAYADAPRFDKPVDRKGSILLRSSS